MHISTQQDEYEISSAIRQAWLRSGIRPTRSAGLIKIKPQGNHPCYSREYWTLLTTDAETIAITQGTQSISLESMQCTVIPPGYPLQIDNLSDEMITISDIGFNVIHSQTLQENPLAYIQFKPIQIDDTVFHRLIEIIQTNVKYKYSNYNLQIRVGYLLDQIICEGLIQLTQQNRLNKVKTIPQWINDIRIYIDQNFAEKITMADLEAYSGYGQVHIRTTFKKHFDLNPFEYHKHHRIMIACQIIRSGTSMSIKNIAERCGYENISLFHRHFKKLIGVTPNQYRKQNEPDLR